MNFYPRSQLQRTCIAYSELIGAVGLAWALAGPVDRYLNPDTPNVSAIYGLVANDVARGDIPHDAEQYYGVPVRYSAGGNCLHAAVKVTVKGETTDWHVSICTGPASLPQPH
jgi:hypothetical protein